MRAAPIPTHSQERGNARATATSAWPELPVDAWRDTRDTLHMWTQVAGKIRLGLMPQMNHWWQVPLYVSSRGLTTSLMPYGTRGLELEFDFLRHVLGIRTTDGSAREVKLEPRSVADFYAETISALAELGVGVRIHTRPVEVEGAIPFEDDHEHASYDSEYASRFWRLLLQAQRVFTDFGSGFAGKASPVNFWWGGFDLGGARFSGRPAPTHPGGIPNCPDFVTRFAFTHEICEYGYWSGGSEEGSFYAYAYPQPRGYPEAVVRPSVGRWDTNLGDFLLPYRAVREAADPDASVLEFLQSTYEAAADLGGWDRETLEISKPLVTESLRRVGSK